MRTSTASEVMEIEPAEAALPRLRFDEPLSWRAGKPIAIADLLRRLQVLSKEMRAMEQEEYDRESFTKVAKELASPNLLAHKDKGVKAWTACCLVDILRLCAPDAPYTGQQLKDIFNLLVTTVLPALSDPSDAYNQQHLYVLESLAKVKSIVLLSDIPASEPLTTHLFTSFFDILAGSRKASTGEQLGKNVEFNMTSILVIMVDESATLPSEVIDVVVAQFLRTSSRAFSGSNGRIKKGAAVMDNRQSTLMLKELPPAYSMAKTVCNSCPEKMARYISQYFNDVIVDASSSSAAKNKGKKWTHRRSSDDMDELEGEIIDGPTDEDLEEVDKVHQLLRELWRASPAVLQNIIPQLEAELSAENEHLRSLATETFGDMISGIGVAGLPPPPALDPAACPPISLSDHAGPTINPNILTKPSSPQPFPQAHPQAYASFLGRSYDKSPAIRSVWTTGIGRILTTSAGGMGLSQQEEDRLIKDLARMLGDADEKVRSAAVKAVGSFSFRDAFSKLGSHGGVETSGSVFSTLAERVRDRKHVVRIEAMNVLARLWGVAAGDLASGEKQVASIIGAAPSKILDTYYANDLEIHVLLDHVLFEQLLPLGYPPIRIKNTKLTNGSSQNAKESQTNGSHEADHMDPDKLRTERILLLVKDLDERAKKVFFAVQSRQLMLSRVMKTYLQRCEDYNGGVMDENEKGIKEHMARLIESFAKTLPEPSKVSDHLWKFAKMHDRRSYQLIRFCIAPESDYRTVVKAIKEFTKRIEQSAAAPQELLHTLVPLLYRVSVIIYNKSHVPAIMAYSRTDEKSLAGTAHEMLREISTRTPEILKAHVHEICMLLQDEAPTSTKTNSPGALENLKACAAYSSKYAKEIPQDRKFAQAMTNFALFGSPSEAAKHAVSIIVTASDKKELLAKDLVSNCVKGFEYGGDGFLARLATLSQLMLLVPNQVNQEGDAVSGIAIEQILLQVRAPSSEDSEAYSWSPAVDAECEAKCWALKILVNRIRSHLEPESLLEIADPVYKLLLTLIEKFGELTSAKNTPPTQKSRLRLLAARLCLKLCTKKYTDALFTPTAFNSLALVAQDAEFAVRSSFLERLKKYLNKQQLPQRFYTIPFLLAFEPISSLKADTTTWMRSRAAFFYASQAHQPPSKANLIMESVFARLLSLLAWHPDYAATAEDLIDFARYVLYYLHTVATEENVSLIYHIAQRVKQCHDAISPSAEHNSNLYHLSDLAQLTIRKFEDANSWNIQTLPGKRRLPTSLFTELIDHEEAQSIAEKSYLPEGLEEGVEDLVKASIRTARSRGKKRRSEGDQDASSRDSKRTRAMPIRKPPAKEKKTKAISKPKTPKKDKQKNEDEVTSNERRRSGRVQIRGGVYREREDEEDDEEMDEGVAVWKYENEEQVNGVGSSDEREEQKRQREGQDEGEDEEEEHEGDDPTPKPSPKRKKTRIATKGVRKSGKRR